MSGELRQRPGDQPLPRTANPAAPGMHDKAIKLLQQRASVGVRRYGTTLQAFNGRDALQDAIEEAADLLPFLLQVQEERQRTDILDAPVEASCSCGQGLLSPEPGIRPYCPRCGAPGRPKAVG